MPINNQTRKRYRAIGHKLHPIVTISKGLSNSIYAEINRALNDHELIKLKILAEDRDEKRELIEEICRQTSAELIQRTGHVALIFRASPKQKAELSNLVRYEGELSK